MSPCRIALIGDYDPEVAAHRAIPLALALAQEKTKADCDWEWLHTSALVDPVDEQLARFSAVWCVPASPYANAWGVVQAIRWARQSLRPFLGTCGGFQHALLEYAEACWGVVDPAHAEVDTADTDPIIAPLACSLVEESDEVFFHPGTELAAIYGTSSAREQYHCRYGLSAKYAERLADGPLRINAVDSLGEVRAVMLEGHPFFVATLFQPERSALSGNSHPLIEAFLNVACRSSNLPGEFR